jgi:hypothetical protein
LAVEKETNVKLKEVIKNSKPFAEPFCVTDGKSFRLKQVDPGDTLDLKSEDKPRAKEALAVGVQALAELQDMLYAQDRWACSFHLPGSRCCRQGWRNQTCNVRH